MKAVACCFQRTKTAPFEQGIMVFGSKQNFAIDQSGRPVPRTQMWSYTIQDSEGCFHLEDIAPFKKGGSI